MSTTPAPYRSFRSLSDLEVRLFCAPIAEAANTLAFVEDVTGGRRMVAANVRSFIPDPPESKGRGMVESALLRVA